MKKIINSAKILTLAFGFFVSNLNAQTSNVQVLETEYNNSGQLFYIVPHPSWNRTTLTEMPKVLGEVYGISNKFTFKVKSEEAEDKFTFTRVDQIIGNYPVVGGDMIFKRDKSGSLNCIIGIPRDPTNVAVPVKTKEEALKLALESVGASDKDYFITQEGKVLPTIELKYASVNGITTNQVTLCYEVIVSTNAPAVWYIYVNATTGIIEYKYDGLPHADGKGTTLYSGQKNINTKKIAGGYSLVDTVRNITTYNFRNIVNTDVTAPSGGGIVTDPNNNFDSTEQKYTIDGHWGMSVTYDYYLNTLKRKSYDGKGSILKVNMRWDKNYNNAFFSPSTNQMYFGKGDGSMLSDFVSLDCVGHEFTHSLVNATANLTYQGESGALNESYADIFGHCIEALGKGSVDWTMFEDCFTPGTAGDYARSMKDPNTGGIPTITTWRDPDTYKGTYWRNTSGGDNGGVHHNSGVQNFWFYLLTDGGSGTNDPPLNHAFSVTGIGQTKSEQIAYLALTKYLTASSDFMAGRKATLLAAEDLHGKNSNEYKQVCAAWYAVGVGEKCCKGDDSLMFTFKVKDTKCPDSKDGEIELTVKNQKGNPITKCEYYWHKGDTSRSVLARSKDITNLDSGRYVVRVKDTVNHCEALDRTKVNAPEKVKVSVSGGGVVIGACQRSFKVTLTASASGGTPPYTYNWTNGIQEVVCSGSSGFYRSFTAIATDKNGCQGQVNAWVIYVPIVCSYDPNEIIGPPSYSDKKWVSIDATLPYKIRYENDPKFATGPAQKVTINHKLDSNTDLNSFRLSSFGFYKYSFNVPDNSTTYSKRLDLRDSFGIYLDVTAGLDQSNREAFWIFESIDPSTGLPPASGTKGFLSINDTITHKGEGFVNYTIKAKSTAKTGDSIRAKAIIVFDDNPPVPTPRIFNLIDAKSPTSYIKSVASVIDSTIVPFTLRGKDDTGGSGLANFDVYVSENGGTYNLFAKAISDTFINFRGNYGSSYTAYSIASDNTENREKAKTTPDISFSIASHNFFKPITPGTSLCAGDTLKIRWLRSFVNTVNLQYSADSGKTFTTFVTGLGGTDTLYKWRIPGTITGIKKYILRSINANNSSAIDTSDYFELKQGPVINLGPDTSFCEGSSFSLNLNPGSGYASYKWSDSATTTTKTVSTYGTYWVKVAASTGCKSTDEIVVSKNLLPVVSSKTITSPLCFGDNNGGIDITVVSGNAPYSYLWNNTATTQDLTNIVAGSYSVTITDKKGCKTIEASTINQPSKLTKSHIISNVKCYGGSDGAVNVTISGGTTPYSYAWSNASTSEDISSLTVATYYLEVTDKNHCIIRDTAVVTQPTAPVSSTFTQVNVLCNGGTTGSITLTPTGGTAPYTYAWTGPGSFTASTKDISSLAAGTYSVVITDANGTTGGCKATNNVTITQPTNPLSSTFTQVNVLCNGGTTGSITLTPAGGTSPYTYAWTGPGSFTASTKDIIGLAAGTYNVVITDANGTTGGCKTTNSVTITQPSASLSSTFIQVNVLCNAGTTGSITLTPSGGTSPYTYAWTGPGSYTASTKDISNLAAGTYNLVITDANGTTGGCKTTNTVTITQPSAALASTFTQVNVLCNGGTTGSITLTPTGGTSPYTYAWTGPSSFTASTKDISGLAAGTYNVVITDANGTTGGCRATNSVTITQPTAPLSSTFTQVNIACYGGSTGSITLTPAGGTTPYTYAWTGPGSFTANTKDISGLAPGTYNVVITDANGTSGGCKTTNSATITQPSAALSSTFTQVNVLCNGGTTGSITLTPIGGTTPYTYAWTGPGSFTASTKDISSLAAGTYNVVITDANGTSGGCKTTNSVTITQPSAALSSTFTQVNILCNGGTTGSITLTPIGGTTPYTYAWTGPGSFTASTKDLSSLAAGTYNVVITDVNGTTGGCRATNSVTISQPSAALSSTFTQVNITCYGGTTGSITLTPSGGTSPYTYAWTGPGSFTASTKDISGLAPGTYNVVITDANGTSGGCKTTNSATITQPSAALSSTFTQVNILCYGGSTGSITLTPTGGTTPYTYAWTGPGSFTASTKDISGLAPGTYNVVITDAKGTTGGCKATNSTTITQPSAPLSSTYSQVNVLCNGGTTGSITLTPAGGTSPYTYAWTGPGSFTASTKDISSLAAGTYNVVITDANATTGGCRATNSVTITQPSAALSSTYTQVNVLCYGGSTGSITLTPSGGTSPYTYAWTGPGSYTASTKDISGLAAGTYNVVITDANGTTGGCRATNSVTITQPAAALSSTLTQVDVLCNGGTTGSITLTPSGGTSPYTYVWTGPGSYTASTKDISGLAAGTYNVVITDANGTTGGCRATNSATITQPSVLVISNVVTDVKCFGQSNGGVNVTISGGVTPYSFSWTNGRTTEDIINVVSGSYTLTVTDKNGCVIQTTGVVNQPSLLVTSHVISKVKCHNGSDGTVNLTVTGGLTPYVYSWNSGDITEDISGKPTGTYKVTVTDKNLCTVSDIAFISEPAASVSSTIVQTPVNCYGGSDGSADLSVAGGTAPYTFAWSNGKTTEDISGLTLGTYYVTILDSNNCQLKDTIDVLQPIAPLSTGITKLDVKCFGGNDGSANLTVTGGTTPYAYVWSNSVTTEDISNLILGKYVVLVTDKNLCTIKDSVIIGQPAAPLSSVIISSAVNCFGGNDGGLSLTVSGGTLAYTYSWSNGATTKDITNLITGKYKVTVTDGNNCILKDSAIVAQPVAPIAATHTVSNAKCKNSSNGSINLTVTGGTSPYTFVWSNTQTTEDAINLKAGHYVVTITDKNGCTRKDSADVSEPDSLKVFADGTTATFGESNGFVFVKVKGGTLPYSYQWNGNPANNNDTLLKVPVGIYIINVTDGNGCTQADTFQVLEAPSTSLIRLGPNPTDGILTVFDLEAFGLDLPIHFELWDMTGKLRMKFEIKGLDIYSFNLDDSLYDNAYMLRIYNDRYEETRKIYLLR